MADNVAITAGSGTSIATDDIGGAHYQRVKPAFGVDGSAVDVSTTNPLPVAAYGELVEAIEALRMAVQALLRSGIGLSTMDPASGRLRVEASQFTAANLNATVTGTLTGVTTVSTVTNQTQMGGLPAVDQIPALMAIAASSARRNISVS
jgi:hypothetical protein